MWTYQMHITRLPSKPDFMYAHKPQIIIGFDDKTLQILIEYLLGR